MFIRAAMIAFQLAFAHGAPGALPVTTVVQAMAHGIDPAVMAGNLAVGHPGARYSGKCGDYGATCGPFRLHRIWPPYFGYTLKDRDSDWHSAGMAAKLHQYAAEKHWRDCEKRGRSESPHGYRAHMKSRHGHRDGPAAAKRVRLQKISETAMCPEPWCTVLKFAP